MAAATPAPATEPAAMAGDAPSAARSPEIASRSTPRFGFGALLAALVTAVVGIAVAWASYPIWAPMVAARVKDTFEDTRVPALVERIHRLEQQTQTSPPGDALGDLEAERARFSAQLSEVMKRLQAIEQAVATARQMAVATTGPKEAAEARASLQELSQRLSQLEKSGSAMSELSQRLIELEKADGQKLQTAVAGNKALTAAIDDIAKRLGNLERADIKAAKDDSGAKATVLAVAQLREALRGEGPFAKELEALRAVAGRHADVLKAIGELQPFAAKGVPTVASLRERFEGMAAQVAQAGGRATGEGWFERTVHRLSTLVTIRRVNGRDDGSPDAVLAEAERFLKANDLLACVQTLERLSGEGAQAAAPWLRDARARIAAERALAALHVHAISLLAPTKE